MSDEKKEIEVVTGNGEDLEISPVYDHVKFDKQKPREKKKNVVVPKPKKDNNTTENK